MNHTLSLSDQACAQINLMLEHDFTLKDKVLRISVDGKGCDGFDYAIGFTEKNENDIIIEEKGIRLHLDQFCGEHLTDISVDYQFDPAQNEDGFTVTNNKADETRGKFWLKKS